MHLLKRLGSFFLDILQVIVFAFAIFLFIYLLVLQPHKIKGSSMEPNFSNGEFLLTDKITYRFNKPSRGDVVVFKAPPDDKDEFIKRIIGLPGDRIALNNGKIIINGTTLNEPYLDLDTLTTQGAYLASGKEVTVPQDSYFVLGDNRMHSSDSRSWGFVNKEKITGRAWVIYWPISKAGVIKKLSLL